MPHTRTGPLLYYSFRILRMTPAPNWSAFSFVYWCGTKKKSPGQSSKCSVLRCCERSKSSFMFMIRARVTQIVFFPQVSMAEKTSGTQGYALYGSLALLPNFGFGADRLLRASDNSTWFNMVFLSWWSSVALGVPCSLFPHSRLDVVYAHMSSRVSILGESKTLSWLFPCLLWFASERVSRSLSFCCCVAGINVLVILYGCWTLAPDATIVLGSLLVFTVACHIALAVWVRKISSSVHSGADDISRIDTGDVCFDAAVLLSPKRRMTGSVAGGGGLMHSGHPTRKASTVDPNAPGGTPPCSACECCWSL